MPEAAVRIIGLGNPLMGDDGIGIRLVEELQWQSLPADVELLDGGCGGLSLLPLLSGCQRLLIIDAADFGGSAGQVKVLGEGDLACLPQAKQPQLSHQLGLAELLRLAAKMTPLPPLELVLIQVASCQQKNALSPELTKQIPALTRQILELADRL